MEGMIEAYLAFARGEGAEPPQPTDLARLVGEIIDGLARRQAVCLIELREPIEIPVRPVAMKRCLANLIGNAARYGRHVKVTLGWRQRAVVKLIDDDGPGIPTTGGKRSFGRSCAWTPRATSPPAASGSGSASRARSRTAMAGRSIWRTARWEGCGSF